MSEKDDDYEDVTEDNTLTIELNVPYEPVSSASQYARFDIFNDTFVIYINSRNRVHRGELYRNGEHLKTTHSLHESNIKKALEDAVVAHARM